LNTIESYFKYYLMIYYLTIYLLFGNYPLLKYILNNISHDNRTN
jgi:hypothetical protein